MIQIETAKVIITITLIAFGGRKSHNKWLFVGDNYSAWNAGKFYTLRILSPHLAG